MQHENRETSPLRGGMSRESFFSLILCLPEFTKLISLAHDILGPGCSMIMIISSNAEKMMVYGFSHLFTPNAQCNEMKFYYQ